MQFVKANAKRLDCLCANAIVCEYQTWTTLFVWKTCDWMMYDVHKLWSSNMNDRLYVRLWRRRWRPKKYHTNTVEASGKENLTRSITTNNSTNKKKSNKVCAKERENSRKTENFSIRKCNSVALVFSRCLFCWFSSLLHFIFFSPLGLTFAFSILFYTYICSLERIFLPLFSPHLHIKLVLSSGSCSSSQNNKYLVLSVCFLSLYFSFSMRMSFFHYRFRHKVEIKENHWHIAHSSLWQQQHRHKKIEIQTKCLFPCF